MSKPGNLWRKVHGKMTGRPTNFSWVIKEELAGSGLPTTHDEMEWVRSQGVKAVLTMTETSLPESWTTDIKYMHLPTPDYGVPEVEDIDSAVDFMHEMITDGRPVMVHCAAGRGRAGTMLCCYLVKYKGLSAKQAITKIRRQRPHSVQSEIQEITISMYEKHLRP